MLKLKIIKEKQRDFVNYLIKQVTPMKAPDALYYTPKIEVFDEETDSYFAKHILMPYLASVYFGIIHSGSKEYISL